MTYRFELVCDFKRGLTRKQVNKFLSLCGEAVHESFDNYSRNLPHLDRVEVKRIDPAKKK